MGPPQGASEFCLLTRAAVAWLLYACNPCGQCCGRKKEGSHPNRHIPRSQNQICVTLHALTLCLSVTHGAEPTLQTWLWTCSKHQPDAPTEVQQETKLPASPPLCQICCEGRKQTQQQAQPICSSCFGAAKLGKHPPSPCQQHRAKGR